MEENKHKEEEEIDLIQVARQLWEQRRKFYKWCAIGAVVGLIVGFSIPKEYSTTVKLAPEANGSKSMSSGLGALASLAGVNANLSNGSDAVSPMLYPEVVESVPFMTSLFDVKVQTKNGDQINIRNYIEDDLKRPWWTTIIMLPGKVIGLFKSNPDDESTHKVDNFQLTKPENLIVKALRKRITASMDPKTTVVTVNVTMQDPLVSALLADTVISRLQEYITDYRTNKARQDLEYAKTINDEARNNYYEAQQRYADYLDRNQGVVLHAVQVNRERLENEASLAFNLYNQTAQQVQVAQAKVQETTPVYTVITPATVPIKATSPRKVLILIGFIFLAAVACGFWVLFAPSLKEQFKGTSDQPRKDEQ
ncbi:MAG: chain-length determining protein [Bacteroidales bacterium]|nr:chain-length determining protein [Bacteroidales bacterium]